MDASSGETAAISIVLADDHAVVRRGLELLLDAEADFEVVASVGDVAAAIRTTRGHKPGVLVLDLNMPGGSKHRRDPADLRGLAADADRRADDAERARLRAPGTGCRSARLRAQGGSRRRYVEAVRRAAAGRTYLNPQLGARIAAEPESPPGPPDDLSEREVEVLRMIALGHTNAEIAAQLYLSIRTVESHRAHIQQKLRRSSRADLVRYALDHGLVEALSNGRTARTVVPDGPGTIVSRPPLRSTRSRMPAMPNPLVAASGSKPLPSSATSTSMRPLARAIEIRALSARACLATFVSASWTRR